MVTLLDFKSFKVFEFGTVAEADAFTENYDSPENLISTKIFYCDGAGWNGKISRYCFGLKNDLKIQVFKEKHTNNEMEYEAVLEACKAAEHFNIIRTDSLLVVNHIRGIHKVRADNLKPLYRACSKLVRAKTLYVGWVPRSENYAGKELERKKG